MTKGYIVGISLDGGFVFMNTPSYNDKHKISNEDAKTLGSALILMAELSSEFDKEKIETLNSQIKDLKRDSKGRFSL